MRCAVLLLLFVAVHAEAQFGVGITLPMGRSTHRLGTVPDSMAVYSPKELDLQPRCPEDSERWSADLLGYSGCGGDSAMTACSVGGRLVVRFTVERDGSLSDPLVVKGGCPALNRHVECALRESAAWEPGRIGYHKVRTRMQVPLRFRLR